MSGPIQDAMLSAPTVPGAVTVWKSSFCGGKQHHAVEPLLQSLLNVKIQSFSSYVTVESLSDIVRRGIGSRPSIASRLTT